MAIEDQVLMTMETHGRYTPGNCYKCYNIGPQMQKCRTEKCSGFYHKMTSGSRFSADGKRVYFFNPMFIAKIFEADGICSLTSTETLEEDPSVLRYECTLLTTDYAAIDMGRLGKVRARGFQDAFQKRMLLGCLYVRTWDGQIYPEFLAMIHSIRDMEWPVATG